MKSNLIVAKFWNPETMVGALADIQEKGIPVYDCYTPFPIHGIEEYMDIKRTRLSIASFIYGMLGLTAALLLTAGVNGGLWHIEFWDIKSWQIDIGGKPYLAWLSFVPISFELTVLFAAHGMVITFFIVTWMYPGKKAELLDIRQTDDVFIVAVDADQVVRHDEIKEIFAQNGAYDIQITT